jgi:hypothetical protein
MELKTGDKIKVVWDTKDATAARWENSTVKHIRVLSEKEIIVFCVESPMTAVNLKRVTKL